MLQELPPSTGRFTTNLIPSLLVTGVTQMKSDHDEVLKDFKPFVDEFLRPHLDGSRSGRDKACVLVEMNGMSAYHVAHSMLATAIAAADDCPIVAFRLRRPMPLTHRLKAALRRALSQRPLSEGSDAETSPYDCFADSVVAITPRVTDRVRAWVAVRRFVKSRPERSEVERFVVAGIWIGDLAYDKHIQSGNPVVDPTDPELVARLREFASNALCVARFIRTTEARAVITAGLAVKPGIPLRAALACRIPAIPMTFDYAWRLDETHSNWNRDSLEYPDRFRRLTIDRQESALAAAADYLERSIGLGSGEHLGKSLGGAAQTTGPQHVSTPWAMEPRPEMVSIPERFREAKTVLVAVHAFYDAPHSSGLGLFSDFYDWLEHLMEIAGRSDHLWLIKLHPDQRDEFLGVREAVARLVNDSENVVLIPSETNHRTLLHLGVDLVLTIYGTIAFEYPWVGVPAVAAQPDSLHSAYSYCHHPSSREEYERLLLDSTTWENPIDRREILEFVYCNYLAPWNVSVFKRSPAVDFDDGGAFKKAGFYALWSRTPADVNRGLLWVLGEWWKSGTYSLNYFAATNPEAPA